MLKLFFLVPTFCLSTFSSHAQSSTASEAIQILAEQTQILNRIHPTIERIDQARVLVIGKSIEAIATDIRRNRADGRSEITFQTIRLLQYLIVQYRFSHVFFGWEETPSVLSIYTPSTASDLSALRKSYENLQKSFGIDDTPYTKITSYYFRQLEKLFKQLENLPLDVRLSGALRALLPEIARTIAIAEQGDRPKTFHAAEKVILKVRALYPEFNRLSGSSVGFSAVMEIQGWTEAYAEFSQFDRPKIDEGNLCP